MLIAIVDDSRSMVAELERLVTTNLPDVTTRSFLDPNDGLEWCLTHPVDLVLVDYEMPGLNGVQFIERLRASPSGCDTPVIMLTTVSRKDVRYKALQAGANDFLSKPFDELELVIRVRNMLELATSARLKTERAVTEAKTRFLSTMAHELRTPLNGILGLAILINQPNLTDRQREYLGIIESCGQTLSERIANILTFASLTSGEDGLGHEPVNIRGLAQEVTKEHLPAAEAKKLKFQITVSGDVPETMRTNSGHFRRLFGNIIHNAVKFTEAGGVSVNVTMLNDLNGRAIAVEIRDTGIGMDLSQFRLFRPLSQKDDSITRRYEGAGLGLAVAHEIVSKMGGRIAVESKPGRGTRFNIVLPLTAEVIQTPGQGPSAAHIN